MGTKSKGGIKIRKKPPQKSIKEKRKSRKNKKAAPGPVAILSLVLVA